MNPWLMIAIGWAAVAVVLTVLWFIQYRTGHSHIADVGWAFGVGSLAVFFAIGSAEGNVSRRIVVATLAILWSVRLGAHLLQRVLTMPEDGRYITLKQQYGKALQRRMFRFFQFQAAGSVLFALPMLIASQSPAAFGILDYCGVAIWIIGLTGEIVSDRQLTRFRTTPNNHGKVCRDGLWNYSRHPNYFFEWLHWWCYVLLAIGAPLGWLTIIGPLAMLLFLIKGTGIPLTEQQALKSRGDAYREYQKTTSAFFPLPPSHPAP